MTLRIAALLIGCALANAAAAQEEAAAETSPWSGNVKLGYLATDGNTDSTSLNSSFRVGYATGNWTHTLTGRAINATQDDATTAEAYRLGWKTDYKFSETDFLFGRIDWRKDRFSGYDQQLSETIGYGRRLIDRGNHVLDGELGAGAKQLDAADGTTDTDFIATARLNYVWTFSESAQFTQELIVEYGSTNTYFESESAVKTTLIGNLGLVASYTIKNNSDVLPGIEETDTYTALSLEYAF